MKKLILTTLAIALASTTLLAFQPFETLLTSTQAEKLEKSILAGLQSKTPQRQVEAAILLHRVRELAPSDSWSSCIIPLLSILNGESNDPSARLMAALVLHELRSERGDFAIAQNARFTDDPRVKRYCIILTRTRLLEKERA